MNEARYNQFLQSASAALSAGFFTASAKKEANSNVSRAYEMLKSSVFSAFCDANRGSENHEAFVIADAALPYELRHVKAEKFNAVAASVGMDVAEQLAALIALRAEIAAAEVQKKVKVVKTVADASKGERLQYRGFCQVCGKEHAVVDGFVAKHGYTVEMGFFNGVCGGQNYAPIQNDSKHAEATIVMCGEQAEKLDRRAGQLERREVSLDVVTIGYGRSAKVIPFAEASAVEQRRATESAVWGMRSRAGGLRAHADMLGRLVAEYSGKELRVVVVC